MSIATIGFLVIILLFVFFLLGLEIGFSMALAGFIGFAAIVNVEAAMNLVAKDIFSVLSSYGFTVIAMFVFMGQVGASGGVARSLYDSAYKFIGHIPGGLALGTVVAGTAFKAICGSSPATAATFATIAVPEMDRYGYDKRLSCGTVATVGTLGVLIPPSVVLIIYGIITETSIGKLFLAGIIPGLMVAFSFAVTVVGWSMINPTLGPKGEKSTWKERFASLPPVLWVITIFLVVVGGLMAGFFTPTEAGSVGTFAVPYTYHLQKRHGLKTFCEGDIRNTANSLHGPDARSRRDHSRPFLCRYTNPVPGRGMAGRPQCSPHGRDVHHNRGLLDRRLIHRGPGLPDFGHSDFSAGGDKAGVRSDLVRSDHLRRHYDRDHHPAGGNQRVRSFRRHQSSGRDYLQGDLSLHCGLVYLLAYFSLLPSAFAVASEHVNKIVEIVSWQAGTKVTAGWGETLFQKSFSPFRFLRSIRILESNGGYFSEDWKIVIASEAWQS